MHIKRLVIEGFKSYKETTELEFGSRHNVVVGKNGSGKSNVFAAVEFILSNRYSSLRAEERQRLLHEGSGRTPLSAFVELTFDNRSRRFPDDRDEITLKRVIGLKKDEFLLNSKHISKTQLDNLLESAGFSRSNPYNIVQQGKVAALLKMSDVQRLGLLKEIAGTRVYDQRRTESLKVMKDAMICREQIQEVSDSLEQRLNELEEEQAELRSFQTFDRRRRAVEFAVFTKEQCNADKQLEKLNHRRRELAQELQQVHNEEFSHAERADHIEVELSEIQMTIERTEKEIKRVRKEVTETVKEQTKLQMIVNDEKKNLEQTKALATQGQSELIQLNAEIERTRSSLARVSADFEHHRTLELQAQNTLDSVIRRSTELNAKQGRCKQFRNVAERNRYLSAEIHARETTLNDEQKALRSVKVQQKDLDTQLEQHQLKLNEITESISAGKIDVNKHNDALQQLKMNRNEATNARKELWRRDALQDTNIDQLKRSQHRAERQLSSTMPRDVRLGIQAMERVVAADHISGVYGMLIELFDVDTKFEKCVSITGANSLFHIVVDTDDTASRVLSAMKRESAGRVTLMPLNQLSEKEPAFAESSDVIPMLSRLDFDQKFRRAFLQVFGKTVIVRSIALGADYARKHQLSAITLDGDQVSRKGAMTGGFIDTRNSRLKAWREVKELRSKISDITSQTSSIKAQAQQKDQEVSVILGEMQKCEASRKHARDIVARLIDDQAMTSKKQQLLQLDIAAKKTSISSHQESIHRLTSQITSLQTESESTFSSELCPEDIDELDSLPSLIASSDKHLRSVESERARIEESKHELENILNSNLLARRNELTNVSFEQPHADVVDEHHDELESCTTLLCEVKNKEDELQDVVDERKLKQRALQSDLDSIKYEQSKLNKSISSETHAMERLLNKRSMLVEKKDDCLRNIRSLGSLPSHALEQYGAKPIHQLMKLLQKTTKELKKFEHVNKKAIDQFVTFTEQRATLDSRKCELDRGKGAIEELIQHLDHKKDDAIRRTFGSIAKHFSQVFAELVPGGRATLVMQASKNNNGGDDVTREDEDRRQSKNTHHVATDRYSGVGIKVSFTGSGETFLMQQLSGGQQTIVALALIFAIQRCDPFPFYLFDEIDSNLDSSHRASVAQLIQRQCRPHNIEGEDETSSIEREDNDDSATTQFICTTFRPEMIQTADTFLGVVYSNKVSLVRSITRNDAKQILESNEKKVLHREREDETIQA